MNKFSCFRFLSPPEFSLQNKLNISAKLRQKNCFQKVNLLSTMTMSTTAKPWNVSGWIRKLSEQAAQNQRVKANKTQTKPSTYRQHNSRSVSSSKIRIDVGKVSECIIVYVHDDQTVDRRHFHWPAREQLVKVLCFSPVRLQERRDRGKTTVGITQINNINYHTTWT